MSKSQNSILWFFLLSAVILNVMVWLSVRDVQGRWLNVPPVPSDISATAATLGDTQFAYRTVGVMLQNLGDTGGESRALKEYDYERLNEWFFLADRLDPKGHFVPFIAAFYFGAVQDPEKLAPLLDYLKVVGSRPGEERWRWLAQAVYLARYKMNDLDKAYELAVALASLEDDDRPAWAQQMPAFILNAKGSKEEALAVMLEILKTSVDKIHPNEVNFTRDYICTRILDPQESRDHPLCQGSP